MGKNGTKQCAKCQMEYSKKLLYCPHCGKIDERRASQIVSLEVKAYHNPESSLYCLKCGTIYPNDIAKCPYCAVPAENNSRPLTHKNAPSHFNTPISKHYKRDGYTIKGNNSNKTFSGQSNKVNKSHQPVLISCKACGKQISSQAESCPNCGQPTGIHVCPNCRSTNTKVISGTSKATSVFLWGVFAANKVISKYECKDCHHKF